MRAISLATVALTVVFASHASAQNSPASLHFGGFVGFKGGVSGQVFVLAKDFA